MIARTDPNLAYVKNMLRWAIARGDIVIIDYLERDCDQIEHGNCFRDELSVWN